MSILDRAVDEAKKNSLELWRGMRGCKVPLNYRIGNWDSLKPPHLCILAARPSEKKMRILVLTFKNHALDEFLLDCRKHCPHADIVRIGGQGRATWACPKKWELQ